MNNRSAYWQISSLGVGLIAEGLEDIRQCIDFILRTKRGSDPLRPLFGSNVFNWIDAPDKQAIPNIKKEIIDALGNWEKRIQVIRIVHKWEEKRLIFYITYRPINEDLQDSISLYLDGGFTGSIPGDTGFIILTAFIPDNLPENRRFNIILTGNAIQVPPAPPLAGFDSVDEMYQWVTQTWGFYGSWYKTPNRIVLYLKKGMIDTPALNITVGEFTIFSDYFITPQPGAQYAITFLPNNIEPSVLFPENLINTREDVLKWIESNWNEYGTWRLDGNALVLTTDRFKDGILLVHTSNLPALQFDNDLVQLDKDFTLFED